MTNEKLIKEVRSRKSEDKKLRRWEAKLNFSISQLLVILFLLFTVHCSLFTAAYALDVKRQVLKNGLTLLVVERHNVPVVRVSVGIKAGNLYEPADKAGLASLTAGLLTEGTTNRTARQISEEIDFVGGSVGASGGGDFITASLSVLKKDIDLGFDLLSDIILNPSFPEVEIQKKKERIKGGLRSQEDDPGYISSREFKKAVFGEHPYGRLITGTVETIDSITRDDLVDFHAGYYVPENSVMAVVGDITNEEIEQLIQKYLNSWNRAGHSGVSPQKINITKERKTITIDKDLTQANIILGHAGVSRDNPDYYAVSVMNYILGGGGFSSRLMQNIRDNKGLVYDIRSYFGADRYGGTFQTELQTKNESANIAIEEVLKEINMIRSTPVTDEELSDARSFLTGSFPMRIETGARIAGFLVAVEYYGLGSDYIDNYPQYINSVTREDVLRVAKKYLDPENYVLVVVADQEKAQLRDEFK
ncbi:MAG: insulinase family protein [Nitrospiraceae bacterium]|nr:MAG: insulinase family protein [Nitrospiraceae bacterium]